MYIDYQKIITTDLKKEVDETKLANLREVALGIREYLERKYHSKPFKNFLAQKAVETMQSSKYYKEDAISKMIITNNIVFDSNKFAEVLRSEHLNLPKVSFDYVALKKFLNLLTYIKENIDFTNPSEKEQKYLNYADTYAKLLALHFNTYTGLKDATIIINKLNEVMSFEESLIKEEEPTLTR